jgi:hypothetical protein
VKEAVAKVEQLASADTVVPSSITDDTRTVHPGRHSQFAPFQGELLTSAFLDEAAESPGKYVHSEERSRKSVRRIQKHEHTSQDIKCVPFH